MIDERTSLTVEERVAAGGFLTVNEFCGWAAIGRSKTYMEAAAGSIRISKIGGKSVIAAPDALAWRDRKRGVA